MIKKFFTMVVTGVVVNYGLEKSKEPMKKAFKKAKDNYKEDMSDVVAEQEEVIKKAKNKTSKVRKESLLKGLKNLGEKFVDEMDKEISKKDETDTKE
jgi:hypothetical protein